MEHLALPLDPIGPELLMPLLATEIYDGGPFLEYLDRHPNSLFTKEGYGSHQITNVEVARHFQSWLFFGLLEECFGDLFDSDDFVRFDELSGIWVLTTDVLPDLLQRWRCEYLKTIDADDYQFSHFESCLDETARMLKTVPWHFPDYDATLGLQIDIIASVAEAIEHCISEIKEDFGKPIVGGYGLRRDWLKVSYQSRTDIFDQCAKEMCKLGGWCPSDIERSMERFNTCEAWHYLRNLRLDTENLHHSACDEHKCNAYSTSQGQCHPTHYEKDCCCDSFEIDCKSLEEIYNSECIPCLKFSLDHCSASPTFSASVEDNLRITIEGIRLEEDSTNQYVAMSHVWSNGTGNSMANSLPKCQLWNMYFHAQGWRDQNQPENRDRPLYVWIDTICCPYEQGHGKWLALSKMVDIYHNAAFVLVVDRQLIAWDGGYSSKRGSLEYLVRLYFSPWMRRLWTCQEAIFAGRKQRYTVVVQFRHITSDWTSLYIRAAKEGQPARKFAIDLSREFIWLEKGLWFGDEEFPPLGNSRALAHVLRHRSTSVAADEALILANLLRFDSRRFIGLTQEDAMCLFWKELSNTEAHSIEGRSLLPKQVVFYPAQRLETPGFRWAPKSFLNPNVRQLDAYFAGDTERYPASLTSRGILASYPGSRICKVSKHQDVCVFGEKTCDRAAISLMIPMPDGSWRISRDDNDLAFGTESPRELLRKHNLCLLTHSIGVPEERLYTYALWVHLEETIDNVRYGHILWPTAVAQAQPNTMELMVASQACAMAILEELEQNQETHSSDDDAETIKSVSERHVREYLISHPQVQEKIKLDTRSSIHDRVDYTFADCVRSFTNIVHYFCHVGPVSVEQYPDDALWCLD